MKISANHLKRYKDIGLHLWKTKKPDALLVYIEATDSTSHLFGHLFRNSGLAGELAEQQKRFGGTVEAVGAVGFPGLAPLRFEPFEGRLVGDGRRVRHGVVPFSMCGTVSMVRCLSVIPG